VNVVCCLHVAYDVEQMVRESSVGEYTMISLTRFASFYIRNISRYRRLLSEDQSWYYNADVFVYLPL